jgi:hypothetical protein
MFETDKGVSLETSWVEQAAIAERATRQWLDDVVIGLNLCPFAKKEVVKQRVRFRMSDAASEDALLEALHDELQHLEEHPETETTLLIHPGILADFSDYNDFLDAADGLLVDMALDGVYQVASFHPDYQFAGTEPADPENYTNRSPFPILHLLREASVETAIDSYPDTDSIPDQNVELMNRMGTARLQALLAGCLKSAG